MSRSQRFLNNAWSAALFQVLMVITGFILPKVMLSCYGSEINGLVSSVTQFVNYFTLVEAGLSGAAVYALYKPLADKDYFQISRVVVATRNFYNISGWIFIVLVIGLAIIYPVLLRTPVLSPFGVAALVLIVGVNGALEFFTLGKYRAILTADQRQYIISLSSSIYCLINTGIVVFLAIFGVNIVLVRLIAVSAIFLRSLILAVYCRRKYSYIDYSVSPDNMALSKRWDALFLQILGTFHRGAPVALITIFATLKDVSIYTIFNMVLSGVMAVLDIFSSGLGASFGDIIVKKERDILKRAYSDFEMAYYSLITFVYAIAMLQIMPFIRLYTADVVDANYNQAILGVIFVLNGYLYNMKTPQGMLVISAGLYKETRYQTAAQAAIEALVGAVLGYRYGLAGVMLGSCLSNLYRVIDLMFFIPHNVTYLPVRNTLKRLLLSIGDMGVIILIGKLLLWECTGVLVWIIQSFLLCFVAGGVIILSLFLFDRKCFISIINRLTCMVHKK
ncbi:lipopolysaccharide biosynthesis protein [Anaerocolumna xylanovorans]|uniref:Membrane protein involved in the export of O-antigen and teichoic acid n=1 Tax=Anaerocolumna xylanovorans DSM 12503 TaxID=1121345 RepID=A0A1M7YA76_9FIRM|nr:hypothetical protein [Anaerocolumna xylanovorans]SHO49533.1 hypothetical protein SAMN02745217_02376 [Anaerocolumna xylanovorans DSM 12503]